MENLMSMAMAIQYHYEDDLDDANTYEDLHDIAFDAAHIEFDDLDEIALDRIADLVVELYQEEEEAA